MSALTIRNIPDEVHAALRELAAKRGVSVEALARSALEEVANSNQDAGIDLESVQRIRAELGMVEEWPEWSEGMDDPSLSRRVLNLEP